jgi:hypothetical protein
VLVNLINKWIKALDLKAFETARKTLLSRL